MHDWKTMMKRMHLDDIKAKAPGFYEASGGSSMSVKSYSDKTSAGLSKCIADYLKFQSHFIISRSSRHVDAMVDGRLIKIQVRAGAEYLSQHNKENSTGLYLVAISFPQFLAWYQSTFIQNQKV